MGSCPSLEAPEDLWSMGENQLMISLKTILRNCPEQSLRCWHLHHPVGDDLSLVLLQQFQLAIQEKNPFCPIITIIICGLFLRYSKFYLGWQFRNVVLCCKN